MYSRQIEYSRALYQGVQTVCEQHHIIMSIITLLLLLLLLLLCGDQSRIRSTLITEHEVYALNIVQCYYICTINVDIIDY